MKIRYQVQKKLVKTIISKIESIRPSYSVYAECDECNTFTCVLPNQGCREHVVIAGRKGKIVKSSLNCHCEICVGIKYYIAM